MRTFPVCAALIAAATLPALEVVGEVPYLDRRIRPEWRLESLENVLATVAKLAEKPLATGSDLGRQQKELRVAYVEEGKVTLRECITALESAYDVAITAEPLRILAESRIDRRDRRRRPVDLDLRDYGMFVVPRDMPGRVLGEPEHAGGGGGFFLMAPAMQREAKTEDVLELLNQALDNQGALLRSHQIRVSATPEEEAAARALLEDRARYALATRRWRATFGTCPPGIATGFVDEAAAVALVARLEQVQTIELSAMNDQRVHGTARTERSLISDAEVVSGRLDPTIGVQSLGRAADLRCHAGNAFLQIRYAFGWVDEAQPWTSSEIRGPASSPPTTLKTEATASKDAGTTADASGGQPQLSLDASAETTAPPRDPGERMALTLPVTWSWRPSGQVALPIGSTLVLCAPSRDRLAVIVLQEVR